MNHKNWLTRSLDDMPRKEEDKKELIRFWNEFYTYLLQNTNKSGQHGKSHSVQYKETALDILEEAKTRLPLSVDELSEIQKQIEEITIWFDEKSIFRSASDIIKILIRENEESAKDYLKQKKLNITEKDFLRRRPFERMILNCFQSSVNIRLRH